MNLLIANYFFILAFIQGGLLIGVSQLYRVKKTIKPSNFWLLSLFFNVSALVVFGYNVLSVADVARPQFSFTIANTFFFMAALFQALFCISLNKPISKVQKIYCSIAIVLFFIIFEVLRNVGSFESRTIFTSILTAALYVLQIVEIRKRRREYPSIELQFLQYTGTVELIITAVRLILMSISTFTIREVSQIPELVILVTIALLVMNTMSYLYIAGYWTDLIVSAAANTETESKRVLALLKERDLLIENLLKANKTVATGALSASIAHELNQPLSATSLNIQLLQKKLDNGSLSPEVQKSIYEALLIENERAANVIGSLRAIFSDKEISAQKVDIAEVLKSILKISNAEIMTRKIQVHLNLENNLFVGVVYGEIHQVLLNLINNAIQAVCLTSREPKSISFNGRTTNEGVQITISDNGVGISKDQQGQLFDLLVSNTQKGMGIGLWLCKYIVERHGGKIWYEDGVLEGAQFNIILPKAKS